MRGLNIMGVGAWDSEARRARNDMRELIKLVALGRVQSVIHQRLPLSEAVAAHRMLEDSTFFGKVVLNP